MVITSKFIIFNRLIYVQPSGNRLTSISSSTSITKIPPVIFVFQQWEDYCWKTESKLPTYTWLYFSEPDLEQFQVIWIAVWVLC